MCAVAETVSATETQSEWKFELFAKDNYKIMFIWKHVISGKDALSYRVKRW